MAAYQKRLKQAALRSGRASTASTARTPSYAVTAVEKLLGLPRDGRIAPAVEAGLEHFKFTAAMPKAEGDRVEINLDTQVLTVFKNWQPILITTTSTGSGEHFCGGTDGCQYAITPDRPLPLPVPAQGLGQRQARQDVEPVLLQRRDRRARARSRCRRTRRRTAARASRWTSPTTSRRSSTKGESVYVVGTAMKPGNGYVGPAPRHRPPRPRRRRPPRRAGTRSPKPPTTRPRRLRAPRTTTHAQEHHDAPKTTPTSDPDPPTTTAPVGRRPRRFSLRRRRCPRSRAPRARRRARGRRSGRCGRRASRARGRAGAR